MPPNKPFLFLQARQEAVAADSEYEAVCRFSGLSPSELVRVNLAQPKVTSTPSFRAQSRNPENVNIDLSKYSGIIIGGSPFNVSDDEATKTELQRRIETELYELLDEVIVQDFPLLGLCYGLGLLGVKLGGIVNTKNGEGAGAIQVNLTGAGQADPLLSGIPQQFQALTGHNEAISEQPPGTKLLASSKTAPIQILKVGNNVYATQFHPELDEAGLKERLSIYLHKGYCRPEEYDQVLADIKDAPIGHSHLILRNFAKNYAYV